MKHFSEISQPAERVLNAAEGLIQQRGYNGFSYDDVAKLVGIKKPSIHHHFATKAELAATVAQRYSHRFCEQLLVIEEKHAQVLEQLGAYAALFEKTFSTDQRLCLCGMLGAESETLPASVVAEIQYFFEANIDWLTKVISEGQRTGRIQKKSAAKSIAQAYLCVLEGAMVVGRSTKSASGPAAMASTFMLLVLA